ncbi:bifunctional 5,10-methylenetetrahydrofolate dehydrogenase/5,10-methenyltetrahydrofolate cyclohydrolase [Helicobacter labacensis]|uniref:bifunctional 5,10-methylenetetrahydrofolate dehydrogenase/5,10-methenyltetrahydrofolate cyclohydrolase n=1 Tax=Helicobacter labacensis TaxID=2316079 RepID=UPI000EB0268E|nr:tetrahydrofolate dehydrogenase/cyclohydrolase catalytic domain-containing protein [Helicobacter labacensis]
MVLLDGWALAKHKERLLQEEVARLKKPPVLAVILVGANPASQVYVSMKMKACARVGLTCQLQHLEDSTSQDKLLEILHALNADSSVHGILVQLPLPAHMDTREILEAIAPHKDVDGFHPLNVGRVYSNSLLRGFLPATAMGVMQLLQHYNIEVKGQDVVVVGASNIIGKPLASLMLNAGASVSLCHILTKDLKAYSARADILCVGVGRAKLIGADMVKEGAVVVDIGINKQGDRIVGDVDFEAVRHKVSHITPVPKGVGPMTISALLQNTLLAAKTSWECPC